MNRRLFAVIIAATSLGTLCACGAGQTFYQPITVSNSVTVGTTASTGTLAMLPASSRVNATGWTFNVRGVTFPDGSGMTGAGIDSNTASAYYLKRGGDTTTVLNVGTLTSTNAINASTLMVTNQLLFSVLGTNTIQLRAAKFYSFSGAGVANVAETGSTVYVEITGSGASFGTGTTDAVRGDWGANVSGRVVTVEGRTNDWNTPAGWAGTNYLPYAATPNRSVFAYDDGLLGFIGFIDLFESRTNSIGMSSSTPGYMARYVWGDDGMGSGSWVETGILWDSGNDGAGSGLDAAYYRGVSTVVTAATFAGSAAGGITGGVLHVSASGGGAAQSPWTNTINAAGYGLTNLLTVGLIGISNATAYQATFIWDATNKLIRIVETP